MKAFLKQNKHLLILLYFPIYLLWFNYVESKVTTHFHVVHTALDDLIPFCEYFVIPYFLWFGYVAWGVTYFALKNRQEFCRLCVFLITGMTLFLIISTVFPNGHYLRPVYFTHHNFCTMLCEFLYSVDTATNLFPSIHVYNSLAIHLAVCESREFQNSRTIKMVSFVMMFSIILATMFIKQHSTFDVFTACLLALVMYRFIYRRESLPFGADRKLGSFSNSYHS